MKIKEIKELNNFPGFIVEDFINKKLCDKLILEIIDFNKFDDQVMSGRHRINKGSLNFKNFLQKSHYSKNFFKSINNIKSFIKLNRILKKIDKSNINHGIENFKFSKSNYGLQKGSKLVKNNFNSKLNIINLDIDFSVSERGYFRNPHIDRETRIINFLIYLNSIPKKDGGSLEIFKPKAKYKKLDRFPKKHMLIKLDKIAPVKGKAIFFKSTPFSYHAVNKFNSKKIKRYFIYGSFSLNKKVQWSID